MAASRYDKSFDQRQFYLRHRQCFGRGGRSPQGMVWLACYSGRQDWSVSSVDTRSERAVETGFCPVSPCLTGFSARGRQTRVYREADTLESV